MAKPRKVIIQTSNFIWLLPLFLFTVKQKLDAFWWHLGPHTRLTFLHWMHQPETLLFQKWSYCHETLADHLHWELAVDCKIYEQHETKINQPKRNKKIKKEAYKPDMLFKVFGACTWKWKEKETHNLLLLRVKINE